MQRDDDQAEAFTQHEAALYLGVTPGLLFGYTKTRFRAHGLGTLGTIQRNGRTLFRKDELDRFDAVLRGAWVAPGSNEPEIPTAIVDHLKVEARNACARCLGAAGIDNAHIIPWATSRSHHHHNLIRICSNCHREHDKHQSLSPEELQALKDQLVARTRRGLLLQGSSQMAQLRAPRSASRFLGRVEELERLSEALERGDHVLVTGVGGVGKSELVAQALHRVEDGRAVLWLDVERYSTVEDMLGALRMAVGSDGGACPLETLPAHLDLLRARIVLDGLERSSIEHIDGLEDAFQDLIGETRDTQLVSTSQLWLDVLPASTKMELGPMTTGDSRQLFDTCTARPSGSGADVEALLEFCDGHALTLRIVGALSDHYGGAGGALAAIERWGEAVRLPRRKKHDRRSSLELCLDVAYEALDQDARNLLWALSNAPAGVFTHYLEENWFEEIDGSEAAASLRSWHLTREKTIRGNLKRTDILAPVRQFAIARAIRDEPEAFKARVRSVVGSFETWVAVMELQFDAPADTPTVLERYGDEAPNLLHILELARQESDDHKLVRTATAIASALMRYFFVRRLHEQGARVLHDAARLAIGAGLTGTASDLAMQVIVLSQRTLDMRMAREGLSIAEEVARVSTEPKFHGDYALCKSMVALGEGDPVCAEVDAREAFARYRDCLRAHVSNEDPDAEFSTSKTDELHNAVSNALSQTGLALLAQERHAEAAVAYRHALQHERGAAIAVNQGQVRHQLGNCESYLGNHAEAAKHYVAAAKIFLAVGMEEYLGNAVSELGYTLLDIDSQELLESISPELVPAALASVALDVQSALSLERELRHEVCVGALRKLAGMIYIAGLTRRGGLLRNFCADLLETTVLPLQDQIGAGGRDEFAEFPVMVAHRLLTVGLVVADGEGAIASGDEIDPALIRLLNMATFSHGWIRETVRLLDWTAAFVDRCWLIEGAEPAKLRATVEALRTGVPLPLALRRRDR